MKRWSLMGDWVFGDDRTPPSRSGRTWRNWAWNSESPDSLTGEVGGGARRPALFGSATRELGHGASADAVVQPSDVFAVQSRDECSSPHSVLWVDAGSHDSLLIRAKVQMVQDLMELLLPVDPTAGAGHRFGEIQQSVVKAVRTLEGSYFPLVRL